MYLYLSKSGAKVQPFFELTKFFFLLTDFQLFYFGKHLEKRPKNAIFRLFLGGQNVPTAIDEYKLL